MKYLALIVALFTVSSASAQTSQSTECDALGNFFWIIEQPSWFGQGAVVDPNRCQLISSSLDHVSLRCWKTVNRPGMGTRVWYFFLTNTKSTPNKWWQVYEFDIGTIAGTTKHFSPSTGATWIDSLPWQTGRSICADPGRVWTFFNVPESWMPYNWK